MQYECVHTHPHVCKFVSLPLQVTTGPLGQGLTNAVGMAMAQAHLAKTYNTEAHTLFDNFTYVFCGDGCMQVRMSVCIYINMCVCVCVCVCAYIYTYIYVCGCV
jgi:transketolase